MARQVHKPADLGTGTRDGTKFLRDDGAYVLPHPLTTKGDLMVEHDSSYSRIVPSSATASTTNGSFVAGNAIDNNVSTFWASNVSAATPGEWIRQNLGSAQTPTAVRLLQNTATQRVGQWKLQSSADDVTWTDRYTSATGQTGVADTGQLALAGMPNAQYWRIISVSSTDTNVWVVTEFTLYTGGAAYADRLPVGSDTMRLRADSTQPLGARWDYEYAWHSFVIDGGGSAITTGVKGDMVLVAGTIVEVRLLPDQSGSMVIDLWKDTYANFPPTVADTITASAKPTLSAAPKYQDTTLTGWTTACADGDVIRVNVDSAATITRCTVAIKIRKA